MYSSTVVARCTRQIIRRCDQPLNLDKPVSVFNIYGGCLQVCLNNESSQVDICKYLSSEKWKTKQNKFCFQINIGQHSMNMVWMTRELLWKLPGMTSEQFTYQLSEPFVLICKCILKEKLQFTVYTIIWYCNGVSTIQCGLLSKYCFLKKRDEVPQNLHCSNDN